MALEVIVVTDDNEIIEIDDDEVKAAAWAIDVPQIEKVSDFVPLRALLYDDLDDDNIVVEPRNEIPEPIVEPEPPVEVVVPEPQRRPLEEPQHFPEPRVVLAPTEEENRAKVITNPIKRQPKRFISERRGRVNNLWFALRCSPQRGYEAPGFVPTQFLSVNSYYWVQIRKMRKPNFGCTIQDRISDRDGAIIRVELRANGEIYINRFGQRAQIRSNLADTEDPLRLAGQRFYPEVPRAVGPQGKKPSGAFLPGILTKDIPIDCPYYDYLLDGLIYPEDGAIPYRRTSHFDRVECLIYIEANGKVCIQRNGYRIQLLPPFNN